MTLEIHASLVEMYASGMGRPTGHFLRFRRKKDGASYESCEQEYHAIMAFRHLTGVPVDCDTIKLGGADEVDYYKKLAEAHRWQLTVLSPQGGHL